MTTKGKTRVFFALVLLGLGLRVLWLPSWGTFDTEIWKAWSAQAASEGLGPMYGPKDSEVPPFKPALFDWGSTRYSVDYPPGTLLVAWVTGKAYQAIDPEMPNRWRFNVIENLPPLLASLLAAALLLRSKEDGLGRARALAFWLNPALLLAAPVLGYQDPVFAVLGLGAVMSLQERRYALATALGCASALVKPQGALLFPVLAVVLLREAPWKAWLLSALAGLLTVFLILAPWWSSGYLLSALDGCLRPLRQNTLAPLGLNVWWLSSFVLEAKRNGIAALTPILNVDAFRKGAGVDPRLVSRVLLLGLTGLNLALLLARKVGERGAIALAACLEVHAYALVGTSVHENHTLLAVALSPLLLGEEALGGIVLWGSSAYLLASLLLAAGLGRRETHLRLIHDLRLTTVPEVSVWVALFYLAFVSFLFIRAARNAWAGRAQPPA